MDAALRVSGMWRDVSTTSGRPTRAHARCAPALTSARDGVWRFLTATRGGTARAVHRASTRAVRERTVIGGCRLPEHYRTLPSVALAPIRRPAEWLVRRETYHHLAARTCSPTVVAADAGARRRRRQRLAVASAGVARPPRRLPWMRSTTRPTAWARARHYRRAVRRRAGRFRRAAVRAAAVRSGRLQRIAALRAPTPRRRSPARAGCSRRAARWS